MNILGLTLLLLLSLFNGAQSQDILDVSTFAAKANEIVSQIPALYDVYLQVGPHNVAHDAIYKGIQKTVNVMIATVKDWNSNGNMLEWKAKYFAALYETYFILEKEEMALYQALAVEIQGALFQNRQRNLANQITEALKSAAGNKVAANTLAMYYGIAVNLEARMCQYATQSPGLQNFRSLVQSLMVEMVIHLASRFCSKLRGRKLLSQDPGLEKLKQCPGRYVPWRRSNIKYYFLEPGQCSHDDYNKMPTFAKAAIARQYLQDRFKLSDEAKKKYADYLKKEKLKGKYVGHDELKKK
jgi:hypothetical protein